MAMVAFSLNPRAKIMPAPINNKYLEISFLLLTAHKYK